MKTFYFLLQFLLCYKVVAQNTCSFKSDSLILFNSTKKEYVEYMEVSIKNNYQFQFIKQGTKTFLKIIVKDNLGFGKNGSLLILNSKKQIGIKDITLTPIDKKSAYFIFELNTNYLQFLIENGMSSFVFRDAVEFNVPKPDSDKIKECARSFYEVATTK